MNQTPMVPSPTAPARARIAMVSALWHAELLAHARHRFRTTLQDWGVPSANFFEHEVPGAFEIPLAAQRLARRGGYDAIVAFALVVDGGIYRHEFVASAVLDGLMRVQLDEGVPVLSVVLTPQAFHDHDDHRRFFAGHLEIKGEQAATAVMQLLGRPMPG